MLFSPWYTLSAFTIKGVFFLSLRCYVPIGPSYMVIPLELVVMVCSGTLLLETPNLPLTSEALLKQKLYLLNFAPDYIN